MNGHQYDQLVGLILLIILALAIILLIAIRIRNYKKHPIIESNNIKSQIKENEIRKVIKSDIEDVNIMKEEQSTNNSIICECDQCGTEVTAEAGICPKCGSALNGISSEKKIRPKSVTIISWYIIVVSVLVLIIILFFTSEKMMGTSRIVELSPLGYIELIFNLIIGIAMLNGINWSRILYLWARPVEILILLTNPSVVGGKIMFSIIFYLIVLYFLTRPEAIRYFKQNELYNKELDSNKDKDISKATDS